MYGYICMRAPLQLRVLGLGCSRVIPQEQYGRRVVLDGRFSGEPNLGPRRDEGGDKLRKVSPS